MGDEELARDLGPLAAMTIGVGTMIGAGIFVLPGAAAGVAGPVVAVSFVIGGVISLFTALSASELGTAMPKAGGGYYYVNNALGPLFGSIAGLGNWMGLAFASAFYVVGFGGFVLELLPVPGLDLVVLALTPEQVAALAAAVLFVGVNYVGAKETGRLQTAIVLVLVAILTVFAVLGALVADLSTLTPFAPRGYGAILPGTALVFVSFLGFAKITTVAEEIKRPGRNLPLAVVGSVVIVTAMYAVLMVVMMGAVNWSVLAASDSPVIDVARVAFERTLGLGGLGFALITFAGLLATASSANASILASSRINFAMGREGLVSTWLNEIHDQFATPYRSIAVTGAIILALVAAGGEIETLAKAGSVLHLVVYGLLNLALVVMREADLPDYDPDFRVPFYPATPVLGAVLSFGLIGFMDPVEIALSLLFVAAGVAWYFLYVRSRVTDQGVLGRYVSRRADELPGPAVDAASAVQPDGGEYRVLVPLANPEHEADLMRLAAAVADHHDGRVVAVHVVEVPDQTSLEYGADHVEELDAESGDLLAAAREHADEADVPVETHTILSHRAFGEVFDAARTHRADLVVMGWGEGTHGAPGRAEGALDELAGSLPCDFLALRDRGLDPGRVLVPTAGGPDSELGAQVAGVLRDVYGSTAEVLYVAGADEDDATAEQFLADWSADNGLADADLTVARGDVETAIEDAARDAGLLVLGATERGLLGRLVTGSVSEHVADDVDCSVLLAERPTGRGLLDRLF